MELAIKKSCFFCGALRTFSHFAMTFAWFHSYTGECGSGRSHSSLSGTGTKVGGSRALGAEVTGMYSIQVSFVS